MVFFEVTIFPGRNSHILLIHKHDMWIENGKHFSCPLSELIPGFRLRVGGKWWWMHWANVWLKCCYLLILLVGKVIWTGDAVYLFYILLSEPPNNSDGGLHAFICQLREVMYKEDCSCPSISRCNSCLGGALWLVFIHAGNEYICWIFSLTATCHSPRNSRSFSLFLAPHLSRFCHIQRWETSMLIPDFILL